MQKEPERISWWVLVGNRIPELTLVENPLMDERSVMNLKSNDSLKQEVKTNFY